MYRDVPYCIICVSYTSILEWFFVVSDFVKLMLYLSQELGAGTTALLRCVKQLLSAAL